MASGGVSVRNEDDEVVLQCVACIQKENRKFCLTAEGLGNRLCYLEPTSEAKGGRFTFLQDRDDEVCSSVLSSASRKGEPQGLFGLNRGGQLCHRTCATWSYVRGSEWKSIVCGAKWESPTASTPISDANYPMTRVMDDPSVCHFVFIPTIIQPTWDQWHEVGTTVQHLAIKEREAVHMEWLPSPQAAALWAGGAELRRERAPADLS
ncbi:unnamed protein product [Boreogadus saida]